MLQRNPLLPPRPCRSTLPAPTPTLIQPADAAFVSAEDFDATGVLAGVDPCESRYWWMPELYGPEADDGVAAAAGLGTGQATRRSAARTTAAA